MVDERNTTSPVSPIRPVPVNQRQDYPLPLERLQAELEDLTTRGRVEIARAIEAARALGDLSENGDYHAAKDSQGKMESRVRRLQAMLEDAEVVDGSVGSDGEVTTGVVVSLRYVGDE